MTIRSPLIGLSITFSARFMAPTLGGPFCACRPLGSGFWATFGVVASYARARSVRSGRVGARQARLEGEHDELGPVAGVQLHHRPAHVSAHGRGAEEQP